MRTKKTGGKKLQKQIEKTQNLKIRMNVNASTSPERAVV